MANCYPSEFLDKFEIIEERYSGSNPEAKLLRDRRARELRKAGWKVVVKTFDFTDLLRSVCYYLEATREKDTALMFILDKKKKYQVSMEEEK